MLPRQHRLAEGPAITATVRRGRRAGTATIVVHVVVTEAPDRASGQPVGPRVGFVVGRAVGGAVVRNRVKRRLRHQMAARLDRLPAAAQVVVRALPAAAGATSVTLGRDLDRALDRVGTRPAAATGDTVAAAR